MTRRRQGARRSWGLATTGPTSPLSADPFLRGDRVVGAVVVPDRAEWPVLSPGQVVFVRELRPRGANYFEQVFALRHRGRTLVRHVQVTGRLCRVWGSGEGYGWGGPRALDLPPADGWPRPDWTRSGAVRPDLRLLGPVVYPYRFAMMAEFGQARGPEVPPIYFAWGN